MILITGNAGFIGRYLTSALLECGHRIRGIDIRPGKKPEDGFIQIEGNILDSESVQNAMLGTDCMIHLAAEHKDFGISKDQYYHVNVDGTKLLLKTAAEMDIKKFIFYSSVAVYGESQPSSDDTLPRPVNDYGASKLEAEVAIREWARRDSSRRVIILRPTVVFGPRNRANIFKLIKQVCDRRFIWVGDGANIKSVAYVENLVDATVFLLKKMRPGVEILNYSDRPYLTTREIVDLVSEKAAVSIPGRRIPIPFALVAASFFDVLGKVMHHDFPITSARIRKFNAPTCHTASKIFALGFRPRYTIEEGFARSVRWYLSNREGIGLSDSYDS